MTDRMALHHRLAARRRLMAARAPGATRNPEVWLVLALFAVVLVITASDVLN